MKEKELQVDILFVGLTRSSTIMGVPYMAFVIEFMTTAVIFLGTGNLIYLAVGIPIHGIMYLISCKDPGVFHSIYIWMQTIGRCTNKATWGMASFSPLPFGSGKKREKR
jgi:type IV secretion system protein VirB3